MSSFLLSPTFLPPQRPIPIGQPGEVLTHVGGTLRFAAAGGGYVGAALAYASPAGTLSDVDPGGSPPWPGAAAAPYGRLLVTLPGGAALWDGLLAGFDGQLLILTNLDPSSTLTLGEGFTAPAELSLPPGDSILAVYTAGALDSWVLVP